MLHFTQSGFLWVSMGFYGFLGWVTVGTSEETQESPKNAPGRPGPHGPPRACQHAPSTSGWLPVNDYAGRPRLCM